MNIGVWAAAIAGVLISFGVISKKRSRKESVQCYFIQKPIGSASKKTAKYVCVFLSIFGVIHCLLGAFVFLCLVIGGLELHPVLILPPVFFAAGMVYFWLSRLAKKAADNSADIPVIDISKEKGFPYTVDGDTLRDYMERQIKFGLENNLELFTVFRIFQDGEWHIVEIGNPDERSYDIAICYDGDSIHSTKTVDAFFKQKMLSMLPYFKIELLYTDDVILNEYKEKHPELQGLQ